MQDIVGRLISSHFTVSLQLDVTTGYLLVVLVSDDQRFTTNKSLVVWVQGEVWVGVSGFKTGGVDVTVLTGQVTHGTEGIIVEVVASFVVRVVRVQGASTVLTVALFAHLRVKNVVLERTCVWRQPGDVQVDVNNAALGRELDDTLH